MLSLALQSIPLIHKTYQKTNSIIEDPTRSYTLVAATMEILHEFSGHESYVRILKCSTQEELQEIHNSPELSRYKMSTDKYPRLNTSITKEQIELLIKSDIIDKNGNISATKIGNQDPLSQLLYSFLWKQGDAQKMKHIVSGFRNKEPISDTGLVLHYFGKHLADNTNPIIDQHVVRAYACCNVNSQRANRDLLTKSDKQNIESYIHWFKNDLPDFIRNSKENRYLVDQIMYSIGKCAKVELFTKPI